MRTRILAALALVTSLASVAQADPIAPGVGADAPELLAQNEVGTEVVLRTAGAEPRAPLRYQLDQVHAQTMVMDMSMEMSMDMGFGTQQQLMPTMRMTSRFDEPTAAGDGLLRVAFTMAQFETLDTPGVDPNVAQVMRQSLSGMGTMSGWLVFDDRGEVRDGDMSMAGVDPAVAQQLAGLTDSMEQMSVPFPQEDVGIGAQWDAIMAIEVNGMSIHQTASYTVIERNEDSVRVAITVSQTAALQSITDPSMPGMTVNLTQFNSTGSGEATMFFNRLVPDSTLSLRTNMSMNIDDGSGTSMPMSMTNNMNMTISTAP